MTTQTPEGTTDLLDLLDDAETTPPAPPAPPTDADDEGRRRRRKRVLWFLVALLAVLTALFTWYLLNRKPLSELPGLDEARLPAYKTSLYGVDKPLGVAVSPDGSRVYVTQSGSKPAAFVLDRAGNRLAEMKAPGKAIGYHVPVYLAVGPDGNVYVADRAAGAVYVYDADGAYVRTFAPKGAVTTFMPLGIAVAEDGTLYVADVSSSKPADHRILVYGPDGTYRTALGKGVLSYPNAIVPGPDGALWVSDSNNGRLAVIERDGKVTTLVSRGVGDGDLGLPRGVSVDDQGRLLVVDTTDHMVRVFTVGATPTAHPTYVGSFGDEGQEDGKFTFPNGLATDTRGRVYVTDRENNRIQVWGY